MNEQVFARYAGEPGDSGHRAYVRYFDGADTFVIQFGGSSLIIPTTLLNGLTNGLDDLRDFLPVWSENG